MDKSQKLLLTWLIEEHHLFPIIKPYISPEDFTEEIYRKTAQKRAEVFSSALVL